MSAYFTTEYTIHFDDTMAYGSHHFLTAFKFQCAAREAFLFGDLIFDVDGVKEELQQIQLLTSDAYSRNLHATRLGDRVAILLSLEDWGQASARFCYRVINADGDPVCAGFQTLICANASSGTPMPLPPHIRQAMDGVRQIEEIRQGDSFRESVLAGGNKLESLFGDAERRVAAKFLSERYASPQVVVLEADEESDSILVNSVAPTPNAVDPLREAWVFAGQGAFDATLFCQRVNDYGRLSEQARDELRQASDLTAEMIGGDVQGLFSASKERCRESIATTPDFLQVAIHLQNVLGARLWQSRGHEPTLLMGHSFGEIAAFEIGGCFDLITGVRIVCLRTKAITQYAPQDSGLLAVFSSRHQVQMEAKLLGLDRVVVAGRNHPTQTVLSGPLDQLDRLQRYLPTINVNAVLVPSPTSFHHPELHETASHWRQQLGKLHFDRPNREIFSPIGRRFIRSNDDIAVVLASQLLRPFDLQGGVSDAIAYGVNQFVDCGSTGSLARMVAESSRDGIVVCTATSTPNEDSNLPVEKPLPAPRTTGSVNSGNPRELRTSTTRADNLSAETIAIVGQGCILPGGATSPAQLFEAIHDQRTGIVDQRQFDHHWSEDFYCETLVADRSTSPLSGRVDDEDIRAPAGIDPEVFQAFSRAQQLLCVALAPCLASLKDATRVMCLIGATADGFEDQDIVAALRYASIDPTERAVNQQLKIAHSAHGTPHSAVQEVFDRIVRPGLQITLVDAACASSLYTIALGMQALEHHKTDAVIAGGCFCPGPGNSCLFSQFHGTTKTGCRPFDASADGVVFSEGAALVTLRRAVDADRLGLPIQAVVRGIGLSSDGRSSSANVPQSKGQILSLQRCYQNYGIDPASIQAIEGHGTSTSVGDATELETLRQFFADHATTPIPVHSLKGLLGHAGWAAGTASLIATCEYLRRGVFPAQAGFREQSDALKRSAQTLSVPTRPLQLSRSRDGIAVDGFGFGGANAHLVVGSGALPAQSRTVESSDLAKSKPEDDLVFVACHHVEPTVTQNGVNQFDRSQVTLPEGCLVLPQLADDMDISQTLSVILTKQIIQQLPHFDDDLRRETGLVLAMQGKTERGIEASARIMADRHCRMLKGLDDAVSKIEASKAKARPSGPYTLQCMMPNVATGRAALLHNLNGPNFVVDSGEDSLEAAITSADLLLHGGDHGGSKLVIVSAIAANTIPVAAIDSNSIGGQTNLPQQDPLPSEYAVAFGITTRRLASSKGWRILSSVEDAKKTIFSPRGKDTATSTVHQQAAALLRLLSAPVANSSPASKSAAGNTFSSPSQECQLHAPVWVEQAAPVRSHQAAMPHAGPLLFVVPADKQLLDTLVAALPRVSADYLVAVVGHDGDRLLVNERDHRVISFDIKSSESISLGLDRIREFQPESIATVERIDQWDLNEGLSEVATDNSVCEFLFLVAKDQLKRLQQGELDLWGLFIDGYDGCVHAKSGAIAGLLKSVLREIPGLRGGCICTQGLSLTEAIGKWLDERQQRLSEPEIVYKLDVRMVRRLRPVTLDPAASPLVKLDRDSVVIATGGAKGVTSLMLETLLREHECTVIALGRSRPKPGPENPDDAAIEQGFYRRLLAEHPDSNALELKQRFQSTRASWEAYRQIQALKSLAGHADYLIADVTDRDQVNEVVKQVVARYGRVDLVIHGAGIQLSKKLEHRTLAEFRKTYATKVVGLANVTDAVRRQIGRPVATHLLTSAYSIFGNDGQHDYGAANETMDRLCEMSRRIDQEPWSSIAWLAWDSVGMTRGSEYLILAQHRGLSGVKPHVGQKLFREVMAGQTGAAINVPLTDAEHVQYVLNTVPRSTSNLNSNGRVIESPVRLSRIDCLPFHKVRDTPTLPGAWILDRMVDAAMQLLPDRNAITEVTVRDMSFMRFIRFINGVEPNVRVIAEETEDGFFTWVICDVLHPTGRILAKDVLCAKAALSFRGNQLATCFNEGRPLIANGFAAEHFTPDPYCAGCNREVDLSGPFECLREIKIASNGRGAKYDPQGRFRSQSCISTLLLDAAWRVAAIDAVPGSENLFVPVKIDRMVIPAGPDAQAIDQAHWEIRSTTPIPVGRDVSWGRTEVLNKDGAVRLIIEDGFAKLVF